MCINLRQPLGSDGIQNVVVRKPLVSQVRTYPITLLREVPPTSETIPPEAIIEAGALNLAQIDRIINGTTA